MSLVEIHFLHIIIRQLKIVLLCSWAAGPVCVCLRQTFFASPSAGSAARERLAASVWTPFFPPDTDRYPLSGCWSLTLEAAGSSGMTQEVRVPAAQLGSPGCKLWNPGSGRWVNSGDSSPSLHVCATAWVCLHKVNYLKRRKTIPPSLLNVSKGKTTHFKLSFQLKACLCH